MIFCNTANKRLKGFHLNSNESSKIEASYDSEVANLW